jgi:hypothetical protein
MLRTLPPGLGKAPRDSASRWVSRRLLPTALRPQAGRPVRDHRPSRTRPIAMIAHTTTASVISGDISRVALPAPGLPAKTPSRSPAPEDLPAKSRGTGPSSATGIVIRDLKTPPSTLAAGRDANTSRGAETVSKQASSASRLRTGFRPDRRSGISRSPASGLSGCVARFETPMRHPFSTPAMQKALKHLLPIRKWK